MAKPLSVSVVQRLRTASSRLQTADPTTVIKPLLERTFALPEGDPRYAANSLTPGAAPLEPSFSELEPGVSCRDDVLAGGGGRGSVCGYAEDRGFLGTVCGGDEFGVFAEAAREEEAIRDELSNC